jgi:hypothetical protein
MVQGYYTCGGWFRVALCVVDGPGLLQMWGWFRAAIDVEMDECCHT